MRILCLALVVACGNKPSEPAGEPAKTDPRLALDLPQLAAGHVPFVEAPTSVTVGPTAIVMDGTSIAAVRDGAVDAQELEGGKHGIKITKLTAFTKATIEKTKADRAALLLDRHTPYRLMVSVMYSMKADRMLTRFDLVGKANGTLVSLPIVLPEKAAASIAVPDGPRRPGADLQAQLDQLRTANAQVKIGTGRGSSVTVLDATLAPASTLTVDQVKAKLGAVYASGLRRCAGKSDRSKTRVTIAATIDRGGRMTKPKVERAAPAVASCLESLLGSWRWPVPKDDDGEPTEVALAMTLEIEPMFADVVEPGTPARVDALQGEMSSTKVGADLGEAVEDARKDRLGLTQSGVQVTGAITPASKLTVPLLEKRIRGSYEVKLRACVGTSPGPKQRVALDVAIDANGKLTRAKVAAPDPIGSCIQKLVVDWEFYDPRPGIGVTAVLTLDIEPLPMPPGDPRPVPPPDESLGMFVSIMKDEMIVWSLSQLEGTLREPLKRLSLREPSAMAQLTEVLTGVIDRRWGGKPRPPHSLAIVLQADGTTPVQRVAEVIAAVRKTRDGKDLFPDVQLSAGFE